MPKAHSPPASSPNQILARLPKSEYQRLLPHLQPVSLDHAQVLYRSRGLIEYAYFPYRGVISALCIMEDGDAIEVANIGNEGVAGIPALFGRTESPNEMIVQVAGDGVRVSMAVLTEQAGKDGPLRHLLFNYLNFYLMQASQSVACNGLHSVQQRCCRWLMMTYDRVGSEVIPLTHQFLAMMLGVRRASVTDVLQPLQDAGWLHIARGSIKIVNPKKLMAAACECYHVVKNDYARLFGRPGNGSLKGHSRGAPLVRVEPDPGL